MRKGLNEAADRARQASLINLKDRSGHERANAKKYCLVRFSLRLLAARYSLSLSLSLSLFLFSLSLLYMQNTLCLHLNNTMAAVKIGRDRPRTRRPLIIIIIISFIIIPFGWTRLKRGSTPRCRVSPSRS